MKYPNYGRSMSVMCSLLCSVVVSSLHAAEVVVDNASGSGVSLTGTWTTSSYTPGYYATNYLHDGNTNKGTKSAVFAPDLTESGTYEVYLRWSSDLNRASNVPVDITHADGVDYLEVNQQSNGGEWVLLDAYDFDAGSSGTVRVGNEGTNGYVIVDAVKFVSVNAASDPMPTIAGSWQLTFQDEFDGNSLDGSKWRFASSYAGMAGVGGNNHENVSVSGGYLNLLATTDPVSVGGNSYSYSGAEVSTYDVYRQQYGYYEARIKYPAIKGLWPAFWMMPDRASYGWMEGYYRSYLKFDLTGVTPGTINSAVLKLTTSAVQAQGSTPNNVVFQKLRDDSWSESTITWNNRPLPDPIWMEQKWGQISTADQEVTIDIKDFVIEQMGDDQVISIVLADTFMRTRFVKFHSKEAVDPTDRPQLIINGVAYDVTEDAQVCRGSNANTNYGSFESLAIADGYGSGTHTYTDGMEIDAMESLGIWGPNVTQHAVHWDGYGSDHKTKAWEDIGHPSSSDDFHTYGVYWEEGLLEFYVDGKKTSEWSDSRIMSVPAFMLLSLQLGGWDNNTVSSLVDDQVMQVDWVRAWSGTRTPITSSEMFVDNSDSSLVTTTGTWGTSSSSSGYYGDDYLHDANTGKGTKSVSYEINVPLTGTYWVYGRWTSDPNRATNVPIDITGANGTMTTTVNQQANAGKWMFLGERVFDSATSGTVEIRTDGTNGYVVADGIRCLRVGN